VNFLSGFMGVANAQRALTYIRTLTQFISQPEYKDLVPLFGIVNEALLDKVGVDAVSSLYVFRFVSSLLLNLKRCAGSYVEAMGMIRTNITGYGAGNGPYIAIGDGLRGVVPWAGYLTGTDRLVLDTHAYFAFDGPNAEPLAVPEEGSLVTPGAAGGIWPRQACQAWADSMDTSLAEFGVTVAGELSNAVNDCGLFVRGVGNGPMYAGDCAMFNDWASWNASMKSGLNEFIQASMDAQQNWFFWTWKVGVHT
jgi:glucan 1,3-beta-glucosidase